MVEFLMMLTKLAPLSLLKIKVFWNKGYDAIILVYNVANKILSHDSNCIAVGSCVQSLVNVAFPWEKLSQPQFYKDLARKNNFFEGCCWLKFNYFGLELESLYLGNFAKGLKKNSESFKD